MIHYRKFIRLKDFDYSQPGAYFITTNIQNREPILSSVVDDRIILSDVGKTVEMVWKDLPVHYHSIVLDEFVIMPDHIHGIIFIQDNSCEYATSLSKIVGGFKSFSARMVNSMKKVECGRLWQRNYYEHVVRDEDDLNRIRQYILDNPIRWSEGKGDIEPSIFFSKS